MNRIQSAAFRFGSPVAIVGCLGVLLSAVAAVPAFSMSGFVDETRPTVNSVSVQNCRARQLNVSYTVSGEDSRITGMRNGYCLKLKVLEKTYYNFEYGFRTHTQREECLNTGAYPAVGSGWFGCAEVWATVRIRYKGLDGELYYSPWSNEQYESCLLMNTDFC